ncbi:DUF397 domain-containing protein [Streptomyces althioticus]|uniref:DUF397 domain-containing protein n=1 Tax=Streptomyces althioticus TaxID=83380 RepID=UPI0018766FE7|nr:hypothetical protein GCM10010250_26030 [Streptomyces althioticus]
MSAAQPPARKSKWFKSSYSGGNATECLEAAYTPGVVLIRDSKRPLGPRLQLSRRAWARFIADVPAG